MLSLTNTEVVGFVELKVGSLAVQVPIRRRRDRSLASLAPSINVGRESASAAPSIDMTELPSDLPLASFETDGEAFAILVRGDTESSAVATALRQAAHDAVRHLSRKLLN